MSAHTPGPWSTHGLYVEVPAAGKDDAGNERLSFFVADCENRTLSFDTCAANARMIAAAPDLLTELQVAESRLMTIDAMRNADVPSNADVIERIQAAIAKATQP